MNFLRENLFMVSLAVGTIVLCLVLVFWSNAISDDIDAEFADRQRLSNTIEQLGRPPYANGNTIMAERSRVEGIIKSLQGLRSENITWNRRNFSIPKLTMLDGSKRAAFPFVLKIWEKNQLASRFVRQYHKQLDELQASLKPAGEPTQEEIDEEAERQEKIIARREKIRLKSQKGDDATKQTGSRAVPRNIPPGVMDPEMMYPGQPGQRRSGRKSSSYSNEADTRAREILRVRKAQEGMIYVDRSPFHLEYAKGRTLIAASDIDPEKLWDAQLGLWVQSDIVAAIKDTIQTAQDRQNIPPKERNVITSPIKRLVSITVGEAGSESRKRSTQKTATPADMYGPQGYGPQGYGPPGYGPSEMEMGRSSRSSRRKSTREEPTEKANTLTQNAANKAFDVVDYHFTVLMPTRYLPLLEESLMKRNYHVILNMQIEPPDESSFSGRGNREVVELSYYGVEPLRKVTISGQLLLLTGFTRGLWDKEEKKWLREPLMPQAVMKKLPTAAQRNEDKDLMDNRLPQPWDPTAVAPRAVEEEPSRSYRGRRSGRRSIRRP